MSEGRSRGGFVAGIALILALAAGGAAGYVFHRQNAGIGVLLTEMKQIRGAVKGAEAARASMEKVRTEEGKSIAEGMRGLWLAVRDLKKDLRKMDARLDRIEGKGGGTALDAMREQLKAVRARAVLLQARVEALERRRGSRSKTVFVRGDNDKKADGAKSKDKPGGDTKSAAAADGGDKKATQSQPPFWNGCIDSLNKSARLAKSAEGVCDCIIGRIRNSSKVTSGDRQRILQRRQFTTRVRGISKGAQTVLEQAVVQCALRKLKKD